MQKKLVQSSLAMAAAAALGLGGAFVAGPAAAADAPKTLEVQSESDLQTAVSKYLSEDDGDIAEEVGRFGFSDGNLYLGVTEKTEQVKKLEDKFDNVKVKVGSQYQAFEAQDKKTLVGGAGYRMKLPHSPEYVGLCSIGFSGWDSEGNQVLVTAGHCAEELGEQGETLGEAPIADLELPSKAQAHTKEESSAPAETGAPGSWKYHQYGFANDEAPTSDADKKKAIDFATVKVNDGFTANGEVTDWTTADKDDLSLKTNRVTKIGDPVVGQSISKSGRTTGVTTGTVASGVDDDMPYAQVSGRFVHGFAVTSGGTAFSDHGDSGGAVYQGKTAVGVISGGAEDGSMSWVADLKNSLAKSGQSFTLNDPGEEPEAPAAPTVEDQTIEPEGEITGKTVAGADVKVTWTGEAEGKATAKADDSGNFTVKGPKAEGEYNAKAVATVDGQSSDAASFKVTVKAADDSDNKDGDATSGADGNDDKNAKSDEDGGSAADGKDSDGSDKADGNDDKANSDADGKDDEGSSDADGDEKPAAPKVEDQQVVVDGQITGKAAPNADVKLTWTAAGDAQAGSTTAQTAVPAEGNTTVKADKNGNFKAAAPSEAGEYAYTATATVDGQTSEPAHFMVTVEEKKTEAPAERKLTVDPEEITAADFVNKDKAVKITAAGFDEGEKVTLKVASGPENVEGITLEQVANADGVAGFSIYGDNPESPEAYLGKYDLQVTGANDTADESALTGSFEVVADDNGNGGGNDGGDDGNGDGGSDLPRTGAELTGLAAGAGLLLVGGAAVVLTMRRKKNN